MSLDIPSRPILCIGQRGWKSRCIGEPESACGLGIGGIANRIDPPATADITSRSSPYALPVDAIALIIGVQMLCVERLAAGEGRLCECHQVRAACCTATAKPGCRTERCSNTRRTGKASYQACCSAFIRIAGWRSGNGSTRANPSRPPSVMLTIGKESARSPPARRRPSCGSPAIRSAPQGRRRTSIARWRLRILVGWTWGFRRWGLMGAPGVVLNQTIPTFVCNAPVCARLISGPLLVPAGYRSRRASPGRSSSTAPLEMTSCHSAFVWSRKKRHDADVPRVIAHRLGQR